MRRLDRPARLLLLISVVAVVLLLGAGRMPQDPAYHVFADTRPFGGMANFWNVVSNVPFLIAGALGLWRLPRLVHRESRAGYALLACGAILVGVGSAVYHHAPSNATLLWDRLPMTVAFMALFALLLGERVLDRGRNAVLWSLQLLGVGAALYWFWSEARGAGDLRPYVLVQFLPILLTPVILVLYPERYLSNRLLATAVALYCVAKAFELGDAGIQRLTQCVSGHTLKHLVAASAVVCLMLAVPAKPHSASGRRLLRLLSCCLAFLASSCVSTRPWRSCAPPCQGPQLEKSARVAVLRRNGETSYLKGAHWSSDGRSLVGVAKLAGPVVVAQAEICALFTQRTEPAAVAENVALVPLAVFGEIFIDILSSGIHAESHHIDWPSPRKEEPYFPKTCAVWPGPPPAAAERPPEGDPPD